MEGLNFPVKYEIAAELLREYMSRRRGVNVGGLTYKVIMEFWFEAGLVEKPEDGNYDC